MNNFSLKGIKLIVSLIYSNSIVTSFKYHYVVIKNLNKKIEKSTSVILTTKLHPFFYKF